MSEIIQPSLFESDEDLKDNTSAPSWDISLIPSRLYESTRDPSQAALDQGWGWQPTAVTSIDLTTELEDDLSSNQTDAWQPPTAAQKKRVRAMIATTRESLRQKRS